MDPDGELNDSSIGPTTTSSQCSKEIRMWSICVGDNDSWCTLSVPSSGFEHLSEGPEPLAKATRAANNWSTMRPCCLASGLV